MALKHLNHDYNARILEELEPGDLVEFPRGNYSHWAVYDGDENVIHISGIGNGHVQSNSCHSFTISGVHFDKAEVRKDNFWDVVEGCRAKKNNSKDTRWSAFSPQEILKRARSFLGRVKYNLITANCEHFAKWCRYDKWTSDQICELMFSADDAVKILRHNIMSDWIGLQQLFLSVPECH